MEAAIGSLFSHRDASLPTSDLLERVSTNQSLLSSSPTLYLWRIITSLSPIAITIPVPTLSYNLGTWLSLKEQTTSISTRIWTFILIAFPDCVLPHVNTRLVAEVSLSVVADTKRLHYDV